MRSTSETLRTTLLIALSVLLFCVGLVEIKIILTVPVEQATSGARVGQWIARIAFLVLGFGGAFKLFRFANKPRGKV